MDAKYITRFWTKVNKNGPVPPHQPHLGPCHEWMGGLSSGYGRLRIEGEDVYTHRVAWIIANGPIPDGLFVLHHCDNRKCVNADHLFLGTAGDNIRDAKRKGRTQSGDNHWSRRSPEHVQRGDDHWSKRMPDRRACGPRCKKSDLTDDDIREIRNSKELQRDIAKRKGITQATVSRIVNQKIWAHVK